MAKYNLLFPLDVTEIKVVSPFGMRKHPVTGQVKLHEGVDLPPKKYRVDGDNILASEDCEVRNSAWNNAGGNYMCLHGASGLYYNYQHLSKRNYSAGQKVSRGTVIAQMGNTGSSTTGTHLHFAIGTSCTGAGFITKSTKIALNPMDANLFNWSFKANEVSQPVVAKKSVDEVAREVLAGIGGWGNGQTRINLLTANGYNPTEVQARVNYLINNRAPAPTRNEYKIRVVCSALNVRNKPSILGKLVMTYKRGDIVTVEPYNSIYAKIVGQDAYISIKSAYTQRV